MKRFLLVLVLLIPSLAFADVMIYFIASPVVVVDRLQNVKARPGGMGTGAVVNQLLDQAIIVATDNDVSKVAYSVLLPEALLPTARLRPAFLGKGLNEVKANYPIIYNRIAQKRVALDNGTVVQMDMKETEPVGSTVITTDIPVQTFFGYNAMTGDLEK